MPRPARECPVLGQSDIAIPAPADVVAEHHRAALYLGNRFRKNHKRSGRGPTFVPVVWRLWMGLKLEHGEVPE